MSKRSVNVFGGLFSICVSIIFYLAGLRQGKNLQRLLCRARLAPPPSNRPTRAVVSAPGWRSCAGNRRQCPACPFAMEPTTTVMGLFSGYIHTISDSVNCQTKNIIYYLKCVKENCKEYPRCEYIGKSTRAFSQRMAEHRDYVKSENLEQPAGRHFNSSSHTVAHLKGCILEAVKSGDKHVLHIRERMYIQLFDTFRNGLNQEP